MFGKTSAAALPLVGILLFTALPASPASAVADPCGTGPRFSGTFIQPDLVDGWTAAELDSELDVLADACIGTQILQWTADSGADTAVYDTALAGYSQSTTTDVVDRLLGAAEGKGASVHVGLQVNHDWFTVGTSDQAWLDAEASTAIRLADDLYAAYGHYESFDGWYLPFEVDNLNFQTQTSWDRLAGFYTEVIDHLHTLSPGLPVSVSPFYNADLAGTLTPAEWTTMWESILGDSAIDIVALQDGVGAGHATVGQLPAWFEATRDAVDSARPSTRLYADTETFTFGPQGLQPMPVGDFVAALDAVEPYVDGFWAFAYDHYQSPLTSTSPTYHSTYLDYLAQGVVESSSPGVPTGLTAAASGSDTVNLSWTTPADDIGIAGYEISRDGAFVAVRHGSTPDFQDVQLDASTTYSYTVRAFDGAGNLSPVSASVSATTGAAPTYANNWSVGRPYTGTVAANASYPDTGGTELTDGTRGAVAYGAAWQGRNAQGTYSFTIDLGSSRSIGSIESTWLQVRGDYVFLPPSVTIEVSATGATFSTVGSVGIPAVTSANQVKSYRLTGLSASGRYVRVTVDGGSAWTMLDEIEVRG